MAECKAAESFELFSSLRDRFSGPALKENVKGNSTHHKQRRSGAVSVKRRQAYETRSTTLPLVPLVEEGDQLQQELYIMDKRLAKLSTTSPRQSPPVKGKWKHSSYTRSNHLNGPDFDTLETASVNSCSSAYSSRSDSGTFSPVGTFSPFGTGSVTELSDVGSCDTFLEYGIQSPKQYPSKEDGSDKIFEPAVEECVNEFVQGSTKAWDKVIGDWVFKGVTTSSPSQPRIRRPSKEIRISTPLSTPLGSTDNLLDSGSGCSLLSSVHDDDREREDDHSYWMPAGSYKLGKFLHSQTENRLRPESNLLTRRVSTSSLSDSYSSDSVKQEPPQQGSALLMERDSENEMKAHSTGKLNNQWLEAHSRYKVLGDGKQQSTRLDPENPPWLDDTSSNNIPKDSRREKSRISGCGHVESHSAASSPLQGRTAEEPASIVAQRAKRFGGAKKYGLRRVQSFQLTRPRPPVIN